MKLGAILPLLMLCVTACTHVSHPSVATTTMAAAPGNAYRLLLPEGTQLTLPNEASFREISAIAWNEVEPASVKAPLSSRVIRLAQPLQLVSPGYIAQRNASELTLLRVIDELREENARLRARP